MGPQESTHRSNRLSIDRIRQNVVLPGRPFVTAGRGLRWMAHCATRRAASVQIGAGGPTMQLEPHIHNFGSTSLFMKRELYEPELRLVDGILRRGDQVLDVGANFGVYTLTSAWRVGPEGGVCAFEPGLQALRSLTRNLALNRVSNVALFPIALSDSDGRALLHHIGGAPSTFSLGGSEAVEADSVPTRSLDSWAEERGMGDVDFVKIDVEGHEPAVLSGGRRLFEQHRPLVLFEVSREALRRNGWTPGIVRAILCRDWIRDV